MRPRAQLSLSVRERISNTRGIALFSLAFYTVCSGFDLSFTLGSQVLSLPDSEMFSRNFHFGKVMFASTELVVVLADPVNHQT